MAGEGEIVEGEVCRISGSGNAMLRTDNDEEYNLGPLPNEVEDERLRAYNCIGPWAICLDPVYVTDEYLQEMKPHIPGSLSVEDLKSNAAGSVPEDDVNRVVRTGFTTSGRFSDYDGDPISVYLPGFLKSISATDPLPVRILTVRRGVAVGVPALETLEPDEVAKGDDVTMTVQESVDDSEGVVGCMDETGIPIVVNGVVAQPGATVRTGVTDVFNTHVASSPSALLNEVWPEQNETVYVDVHRVTPGETAYGLSEVLPVVIPQSKEPLQSLNRFKASVIERSEGRLTVSVGALGPDERPEVGDSILCEVIHHDADGTLCRAENVPIWVPGTVPETIQTLALGIVDETPSSLVGSITEIPEVESLEVGDSIAIQVSRQDGDDGVGIYEEIPVVVPGGEVLVGNRVTLGVADLREGFLVAGVEELSGLPEVGEEIVLSVEQIEEYNGRICSVGSTHGILPAGSDFPRGEVRLGVEGVSAAGVSLSVAALPSRRRPEVGDEIQISPTDLTTETSLSLVEGIPVKLPPYEWGFNGPLRLGVSGVQKNCVRCSIRGLDDKPSVGEREEVIIDENFEGGCGGRIDGLPTYLPRAEASEGETQEVIVVGATEERLVAVETDPTHYGYDKQAEDLATYYRSLIDAKEAWQSDDFEEARKHCRTAKESIKGDSSISRLLRLDMRRQDFLLRGEIIRKEKGPGQTSGIVHSELRSLELPDTAAADAILKELEAYRFTLAGIQENGLMITSYLEATVRAMTNAKDMEHNPWENVIPHPIIATLLADIRLPNEPAAEELHQFIGVTPEYWPFLTLSEVTDELQ